MESMAFTMSIHHKKTNNNWLPRETFINLLLVWVIWCLGYPNDTYEMTDDNKYASIQLCPVGCISDSVPEDMYGSDKVETVCHFSPSNLINWPLGKYGTPRAWHDSDPGVGVQERIGSKVAGVLNRECLKIWHNHPDSKVHGANIGAHLGPAGPRWASCRPHELCYLGRYCIKIQTLWNGSKSTLHLSVLKYPVIYLDLSTMLHAVNETIWTCGWSN